MKIANWIAPRRAPANGALAGNASGGASPAARPLSRRAVVQAVSSPAPWLRRIVLAGEDLRDVRSARFDDHVKLVVPGSGQRRSYTIAALNPDARTMTLECVLHGDGPAARWAQHARQGEHVTVLGPKPPRPASPGDVSAPVGTLVLLGDATALPAIARCLREAPAHAGRVLAHVVLDDPASRPADVAAFRAQDRIVWGAAGGEGPYGARSLRAMMRECDWSRPGIAAWIATETVTARLLRADLLEEEAMSPRAIRAAGYWRAGVADGGARL